MRRPLPLFLTALLLGPAFAPPATAGSPAATLTWEAAGSRSAERSLLLVLEVGAQGWSLVDARTAPIAAKIRRGGTDEPGPLFALLDRDGRPLAAGRLRVPSRLHGPVLDDEGEMRCVSVPMETATLALRLPLAEGAAELAIFEAAEFAPTAGDPLAAALRARPADAGLRRVASFALGALVRDGR